MCDQVISNTIFFERKILGSHVRVFVIYLFIYIFFEKWWPIIDNEIGKYLWASEKCSWRPKIIYE